MDFTLSDEQLMFAETAETLFYDLVTPEHWRKLMESGDARDAALWNQIVETGLTLIQLPEEAGGLGLGALDFALIAEKAGYVALSEPLVDSAGVAAPMLAALAPDDPVLADPAASIAIQQEEGGLVLDADSAAAIILRKGDQAFVASPDQVTLTRRESIDPMRRLFAVEWDDSKVQPLGQADWDLALDRGAIFAAAQGLGLAQRAVDMAVEYAKERQQFGKPIGSYQAVKHHLSTAQTAIEFARPVVLAAAATLESGDIQSRARISHAKIVALEAADVAARTSIQVHGAMGYSWEVDVHLFLKRALALTSAWGTPYFHRQRVAARLFTQPVGPSTTFARENENG
ncbi:acyl-CoA dehydrogenase family protein [Sphingopyxis yananensis]|uniref:acyl-CoA dehydrogenase family protein n=1 Tax=Sphingopyxis yananensis TaxID=2886687 RepID=UPI001D1080B1|nr:acyl-CoA dehydrogenase family protein [Sphingopyxis yananensis]MCC2603724.1 acyl-CoA/acyl-ACP dehydrogenase [Sphingopyxis yananensis]